jgi:hypothetical protein
MTLRHLLREEKQGTTTSRLSFEINFIRLPLAFGSETNAFIPCHPTQAIAT